jgi:CrcB protein
MNIAVIASIGLGGALGAVARFKCRDLAEWLFGEHYLWGTLLANVIGCFIAGFLLIFWQAAQVSNSVRFGVVIGFLGALTTFSTFSVETFQLMQQHLWLKAGLNISANLLLCMLFVFFGAWLGGRMAA